MFIEMIWMSRMKTKPRRHEWKENDCFQQPGALFPACRDFYDIHKFFQEKIMQSDILVDTVFAF